MKKLKCSVMTFFAIMGISQAQVRINATTATTISTDVIANNNNAIGSPTALQSLTTGLDNYAFGLNALNKNTTGNYNYAFGRNVLISNVSGNANIGIGHACLSSNTGNGNHGFGQYSLNKNTSGNYNNAAGVQSLMSNTTGSGNIAIGQQSIYNNTVGSNNIGFGTQSLLKNISGSNNIAIGKSAGSETLGSNNVYLGFQTGNLITGNNNTIIGSNILGDATLNNHVIIGDGVGNQRIFINNLGNMGLGTNTPTAKLEIAGGDLKIATNRIVMGNNFSNWALTGNNYSIITNRSIIIEGSASNDIQSLALGNRTFAGGAEFGLAGGDGYHSNVAKKADVILRASTPGSLIITNEGTSGINDIKFVTKNTEPTSQVRMTIDKKGKVLVGTNTAPTTIGTANVSTYNLFVKGGILTEEMRVRLATDWADYVFNKNYQLKPLKEVEKFINTNGHLPNVPSAKEVKENGLELGTIATIQQEKIEELTLYAIQQQKEIEDLKALVKTLVDKK